MKNFKIITISILILILTLSAVSAQDNLTSDTNNNSINEIFTEEGATSENYTNKNPKVLQNEIDKTENNGTILIKDTYLINETVNIRDKNITLTGENATLKTKTEDPYSNYILNIENSKSNINNIIFDGGNHINSINSHVIIKNCTFSGFQSIYSDDDSNLEIYDCNFNDVYGAIVSHKTLTVYNSIFTGGEKYFDGMVIFGGAIYSLKNTKIINCTFISCESSLGGAIYSEGALNINSSIFKNNKAGQAGAIYSRGKTTITDTKFINNIAENGYVQYLDSQYDWRQSYGGAIISEKYLNISNSLFLNNTAKSEDINDFYSDESPGLSYGGAIVSYKTTEIHNTTFINNLADYAGAIYSFSDIKLENVTLTNNGISSIISIDKLTNNSKNIFSKNVVVDDNLKSKQILKITLKIPKIQYGSKNKIEIKITNTQTKKALKFFEVYLHTYNGKKWTKQFKISNNKGIIKFDMSSNKVGTYKIKVESGEIYPISTKTTTVKVTKAKTTVKAPKVTAKLKKSKYFKVTVKAYKKPVKNVKIKIKVYTGKKYKTYTVKTNKKGLAQINTKTLKKGTHKVVISSANTNYNINTKSKIIIRK